jgi:hypothetical protein
MALKPNQLQVTTHNPQPTTHNPQPTTHKQMQSLSDYTKKMSVNDILKSFDLENNHENLEKQQDNPFDYFLQSTAWLPGY